MFGFTCCLAKPTLSVHVVWSGDPLDAIILGKRLPLGHQGIVRVKGIIKFTDAGLVDNKLICTQRKPGMLCLRFSIIAYRHVIIPTPYIAYVNKWSSLVLIVCVLNFMVSRQCSHKL